MPLWCRLPSKEAWVSRATKDLRRLGLPRLRFGQDLRPSTWPQQGDQPPHRTQEVSARSPLHRAVSRRAATAPQGTTSTRQVPLLSTTLPSSGTTGHPDTCTARRTCRPEKRTSTAIRNRSSGRADAHETLTSADTLAPYAASMRPVTASGYARPCHTPCSEAGMVGGVAVVTAGSCLTRPAPKRYAPSAVIVSPVKTTTHLGDTACSCLPGWVSRRLERGRDHQPDAPRSARASPRRSPPALCLPSRCRCPGTVPGRRSAGAGDDDAVRDEQCSRPVDRTREGCLAERGGRTFPSDRFLVIE